MAQMKSAAEWAALLRACEPPKGYTLALQQRTGGTHPMHTSPQRSIRDACRCHQQPASRELHVLSQPHGLRTAKYRGADWLVVPVTALVEGVMHAVNAQAPELVLASEFSIASGSWNGRPIVMGHPEVNGHHVSANHPEVLEAFAFGTVFATRVAGNRLEMEAWINPAQAIALGGDAEHTLRRILAGQAIEVSVGVFMTAERAIGIHNGKRYAAIWRQIAPDHLAFLPDGAKGACSITMGCGTRAAVSSYLQPAGNLTEAISRRWPSPSQQQTPPSHGANGYTIALARRAQEEGR